MQKGVGLTKKTSPRQKAHTRGVGRIGEDLFRKFCAEMNWAFEDIHESAPCDFIVNGKFVEVKTSKTGRAGRWCFDFRHNPTFDFLVCYGEHKGSWHPLVIPAADLRNHKAISVTPFSFTYGWEYWSKYLGKVEQLINN